LEAVLEQIHATAVDVSGKGVLLYGPSGSGKSDLALRLMDRGASFIADDQVVLTLARRGLKAEAPERLRGFMEVRGLGIVSRPVAGSSLIALVVELVVAEDVPRLPEKAFKTLLGKKIPLIRLNAFEVSAPIKIELAVGDTSIIGGTGPDEPAEENQSG
jgi:HPr kinase/phosphorylase